MNLGGGGTAYYVYSGGQRVRKVIENGTLTKDRLYLGSNEIYRKKISGSLDLERETLHISDDTGRIALVDTKTYDGGVIGTPTNEIRYQLGNHLQSASLELDTSANIISYEEYHPFGTSAYRLGSTSTEVSQKRYRYCGKERDEESGLYYYGARYYAAWLCRFISVDPMKEERAWLTPYNYVQNNSINLTDPTGALDTGGGDEPKGETQSGSSSDGLSAENEQFFKDVNTYVDSEIKKYETKLHNLEKKYVEKKWKIDKDSGNFKTYQDRIDTLKDAKADFNAMKEIAMKSGENNLLTLANVVHNEAAQSNEQSKSAVAYAYLNRIGYSEGGTIREPKGAEISDYSKLLDRWKSFDSADDPTSAKLTFLKTFRASFDAAQSRLADSTPAKNDPTQGATHWISPMADIFDSPSGKNTQKRTINGKVRYVPEWARSNKDPELKSYMSGADAILNADFKEIQLNTDFHFFKEVKY